MKDFLGFWPLVFLISECVVSGLAVRLATEKFDGTLGTLLFPSALQNEAAEEASTDNINIVDEPRMSLPYPDVQGFEEAMRRTKETAAYKVVDGDMLYTRESWEEWTNLGRASIRPDVTPSVRWPKDDKGNVLVPYELDMPSFLEADEDPEFVLEGFRQWENGTCIKAVPKQHLSNSSVWANHTIIVTLSGFGCSSYVGMSKKSPQLLRLGPGCRSVITAAHEFGHALGLGHEHQRSDRANHLIMFPENHHEGSFLDMNLEPWINFKVPFNYMSNLHYIWYAFSKNYKKNIPTMLPKDPTMQYLLTGNNNVSHYDRLVLNRAYGCIETWRKKCNPKFSCKNWGYIGPDCKCICPEGTSGDKCENLLADSLPVYPPPECGGHVVQEGSYLSINKTGHVDCVWWIHPPKCYVAKVAMTKFQLKVRDNDSYCGNEYFGVRSISLYEADGKLKCGNDTKPGDLFFGKNDIVLDYQSFQSNGNGNGVGFSVTFEVDPACFTPIKSSVKQCSVHKHKDGSVSVNSPVLAGSGCNLNVSLPGAKWIQIASKKFDVPSEDKECMDGYLALSGGTPADTVYKCNREYMSHVIEGSEVGVIYRPSSTQKSKDGFQLLFYPSQVEP